MNPLAALLQSEVSAVVVIPIALALFTVIVFVHELGHFAAARRFGVHVRDFAIGFPPTIWSRLIGGRVVRVRLLAGEARGRISGPLRRVSADDQDLDVSKAIAVTDRMGASTYTLARAAAAAGARALIVVTGDRPSEMDGGDWPVSIPIVAMDPAAPGRLLQLMRYEMVVAELSFTTESEPEGLASREAWLRLGATRLAINAIPLGGYVRMSGEDDELLGTQVSDPAGADRAGRSAAREAPPGFSGRPPWQRAIILLAGPLMNFALAPLLFMAASLLSDVAGVEVTAVAPDSPAARAGLAAGDRLVQIGERAISSPADLSPAIGAYLERDVTIRVRRGESERTLRAAPRANPPPGEGALGVRVAPFFEPAPLTLAVPRALQRTVDALLLLPMAVGEALSGGRQLQVSSIVGIVDTVGQAARQGPEVVFYLAAFLTAQIGLINLLPWPGLDGGRLVFVGFEWLTGRRLAARREAAFHLVGILLLLTLVVVITVGDVQRLLGS